MLKFVLAGFLLLLSELAFPQGKKVLFEVASSDGKFEFKGIGKPKGIKIHGIGPGPSGNIRFENTLFSGSLSIALANVDTGIRLRNTHMRERYLETDKYPEAKLDLHEVKLKEISNKTHSNVPFTGTLKIRGVSQIISGTADIQFQANSAKVTARFPVDIDDFKIPTPVYMGITMSDKVDVEVSFVAVMKP